MISVQIRKSYHESSRGRFVKGVSHPGGESTVTMANHTRERLYVERIVPLPMVSNVIGDIGLVQKVRYELNSVFEAPQYSSQMPSQTRQSYQS